MYCVVFFVCFNCIVLLVSHCVYQHQGGGSFTCNVETACMVMGPNQETEIPTLKSFHALHFFALRDAPSIMDSQDSCFTRQNKAMETSIQSDRYRRPYNHAFCFYCTHSSAPTASRASPTNAKVLSSPAVPATCDAFTSSGYSCSRCFGASLFTLRV